MYFSMLESVWSSWPKGRQLWAQRSPRLLVGKIFKWRLKPACSPFWQKLSKFVEYCKKFKIVKTCLFPILAAFLISNSSFFSSLSNSLFNVIHINNTCIAFTLSHRHRHRFVDSFDLSLIWQFGNFLTFYPFQHPWSPCAVTCHLLSAGLLTKKMN